MQLNLTAIKKDSIWVFDHEHQNTVEEPLCNGTELVLNEYFEIDMNRQAKVGDQLQIVLNTEAFDGYDTELKLQSTDDNGSTYLDTELFEEVWLCPWLQGYFNHVPQSLFVKIDAVNLGKVAFEESRKRGVNPFSKYLKNITSQ
jgi:hypothetical protein